MFRFFLVVPVVYGKIKQESEAYDEKTDLYPFDSIAWRMLDDPKHHWSV